MKKIIFFLTVLFISHAFSAKAQNIEYPSKSDVREVPDSVVTRMKNDKDFAYANDMSYWKKEPPRDTSGFEKMMSALSRSVVLRLILYSLLIAVILYALYQVMVINNFFIFSRVKRNRNKNADGDDVSIAEDLDEKINEAISRKNYRHAIRYMYLRTLKLLSEENLITLHAKSTNQDYIRQLYKHNDLAQFRQLTRIYEYVWYGEFDPTETQFDIIRTNFTRFNRNS